jgi:hypothetical protein
VTINSKFIEREPSASTVRWRANKFCDGRQRVRGTRDRVRQQEDVDGSINGKFEDCSIDNEFVEREAECVSEGSATVQQVH